MTPDDRGLEWAKEWRNLAPNILFWIIDVLLFSPAFHCQLPPTKQAAVKLAILEKMETLLS